MQAADDIGRLPPDVLSTVLQQLPLKDRLQSASLVCKGWHAASITATRAITRRFRKSQHTCCQSGCESMAGRQQ